MFQRFGVLSRFTVFGRFSDFGRGARIREPAPRAARGWAGEDVGPDHHAPIARPAEGDVNHEDVATTLQRCCMDAPPREDPGGGKRDTMLSALRGGEPSAEAERGETEDERADRRHGSEVWPERIEPGAPEHETRGELRIVLER